MSLMTKILAVFGAAAAACLLYVGGLATNHLWADHIAYHSNAQLLELVRTAVVELHPELIEEAAPE